MPQRAPTLDEQAGSQAGLLLTLLRLASDRAPSSFQSSLMASIEADHSPTLDEVDRLLHAAGVTACTVRDRALLHEACACVSTRAARLSATATAALLEHAQLDQVSSTSP